MANAGFISSAVAINGFPLGVLNIILVFQIRSTLVPFMIAPCGCRPHGTLKGTLEGAFHTFIWEFPKIRGTLFWGPYHKHPTI